jgi:hypothetical protein
MRAVLAILAMPAMSVMTPPGLAMDSMKIALVFGVMAASSSREIVGIGPLHAPAEVLEAMVELVDRAAIELVGGDDFVAGRQHRVEHEKLRRMAGGHRQRRRAALERRDALLEHGLRRIGDAGVDVAEGLQAEQRGRVVHVVEDEGRGLVDRRHPRAGRRVGLRARMNGEGGKAGSLVGHDCLGAFGLIV